MGSRAQWWDLMGSRAAQAGKGVSRRHLTPLTDGNDRSSVDSALFFVGADHAVNGGMAMGMQGWSCGFRIAQALGYICASTPFSLEVLPERQRQVITMRRRRRIQWVAGLATSVVAALSFVLASRFPSRSLLRCQVWTSLWARCGREYTSAWRADIG